jgi:hypothetical protein
MTLAPPARSAPSCPRCTGPMFLEALDVVEYVCLACGEHRFIDPRRAPRPEASNRPRRRALSALSGVSAPGDTAPAIG